MSCYNRLYLTGTDLDNLSKLSHDFEYEKDTGMLWTHSKCEKCNQELIETAYLLDSRKYNHIDQQVKNVSKKENYLDKQLRRISSTSSFDRTAKSWRPASYNHW